MIDRDKVRAAVLEAVPEYADTDYGTYEQQADNITDAVMKVLE